jgi:mannose-6-phosphate isomerase-like protein (cupin superfamily)
MMRLLEMKGDSESTDEVVIPGGMKANWLRFADTRAEHRVKGPERHPGGQVEVAVEPGPRFVANSRINSLARGEMHVVENGEWHRWVNPHNDPLTVLVTLKPTWNPKRAYFRLGEREFRGDEVWFEVKTHVSDRIARAMYKLHDFSAELGNVSCRLAPKVSSIETFHKEATVTIKCTSGVGEIVLNAEPKRMEVGDTVVVDPGEHYQLRHLTSRPVWSGPRRFSNWWPSIRRTPFEVNQMHRPQWEPADTFYVDAGTVIPADLVWFEFVVP